MVGRGGVVSRLRRKGSRLARKWLTAETEPRIGLSPGSRARTLFWLSPSTSTHSANLFRLVSPSHSYSTPPPGPSDLPSLLRQQPTLPSPPLPTFPPRDEPNPLPSCLVPPSQARSVLFQPHPSPHLNPPPPPSMHFLSTLAPLALLLTSSTVDASGHGHKRSNRHGPAKRAAVSSAAAEASASSSAYVGPTAAEVYAQDAKKFVEKRANAPRKKRATCSSTPHNATTSVINVDAAVRPSSSAAVSAASSAAGSSSKTSSAAPAAATTKAAEYNSGWKLDVVEVSPTHSLSRAHLPSC